MDSRAKRIDRAIKQHDSYLFIQETRPDRFDIYRKNSCSMSPPHFIFSLTDNWHPQGRPVEWSSDIVLNRIKAHDLWRDENYANEIIRENEKAGRRKERALKNSIEAFMYDFHSQFKRTTSDINTANMGNKF